MNIFDTNDSTSDAYLTNILEENGFTFSLDRTSEKSSPGSVISDAVYNLKTTLTDRYAKGNITLDSLKSLGFSIDTILVSCRFNMEPCYPNEFHHYFTYEYGNCYSFHDLTDANGNDIITKRSLPGKKHGLDLELFTGIPGKLFLLK